MKKSFLIVSAIALASAASSYADLTINIAGSSAFRAAAFTAIRTQLGAGYKASYTDPSGTKDSSAAATFQKNVGGSYGLVTIKCAFGGSSDGCDAAASPSGGFTTNFIPPSSLPSSGENYSQTANSSEVATVGFSDIYLSSAGSSTHVLRGYSDSAAIETGNQPVGVIQFQLVTNKAGKDAGLTNITSEQIRLLWANGNVPSTGFGIAGKTVYATGRKADSGTRATILAESGYGLSSNVIQYKVNGDGTLTSLADSGDSAANTAGFLNNNSCTNIVIGYLGNSDAATVTQGQVLAYNGQTNTDANIKAGIYTMWSYEHLYQRTGAPALQQSWLASLTWDAATLGSAGIAYGDMACSRSADGGLVGF